MRLLVGVILAVLGLVLFGVWSVLHPPSATLRYRLTLVVDDNGKETEGSSVVEVTLARNGLGTPFSMGMRGEAAAVDLGARGLLFAVLGDDWLMFPERVVAPAFGISRSADRLDIFKRIAALPPGSRADLPSDKLPMLVRFRDINDPKTVERVDPGNLSASFGPGVRLTRATIEVTDDPVMTGIEKRLPGWFVALRNRRASLDGDTSIARSSNALSNILGTGHFSQGIEP